MPSMKCESRGIVSTLQEGKSLQCVKTEILVQHDIIWVRYVILNVITPRMLGACILIPWLWQQSRLSKEEKERERGRCNGHRR